MFRNLVCPGSTQRFLDELLILCESNVPSVAFLRGRDVITEEFFAELLRTKDEFAWQLERDVTGVPERRSQDRLRARASHKELATRAVVLDPIGAVCYALTRELHAHEHWQEAANAIQLSLISASDLIAAANDRTWKGKEGHREPDEYLLTLRTRLLATVGLKAP